MSPDGETLNQKWQTPCPCMRILSFCAVIIKEWTSALIISLLKKSIGDYVLSGEGALVLSDALTD
jgi:hypothetical protein